MGMRQPTGSAEAKREIDNKISTLNTREAIVRKMEKESGEREERAHAKMKIALSREAQVRKSLSRAKELETEAENRKRKAREECDEIKVERNNWAVGHMSLHQRCF